jgi:hypothetical protein
VRLLLIKQFLYVFLFFFAHTSNSLIVKLTDINTMAKRSDIVVHGYVGEQIVTHDELGRLITLSEVEVIDAFYGAKTGEVITMYQVGGQKNGMVMPMLGGQRYQIGQEVILFGLKLGNTYVSYGAGQGKLDVVKEGGHEVVIEDLGDVSALTRDGNGKTNAIRPMPLQFSSKELILGEIKEMIKSR